MKNKKIYRIFFIKTEEFYTDVEAENKKQAMEKWGKEDLTNEKEVGNLGIEIVEVEQIN